MLRKCFVVLSKCFVVLSKCFVVLPKCFVVLSKCLVVLSKCLVVLSKCFVVLSKCFVVLSKCFVVLGCLSQGSFGSFAEESEACSVVFFRRCGWAVGGSVIFNRRWAEFLRWADGMPVLWQSVCAPFPRDKLLKASKISVFLSTLLCN